MATQLQIRRGTSTQVAAFTGAEGEIVVNTTNDSVHVNDGSTAGGFELARADFGNISTSATLTIATLNTTNLDLTNLEVTNLKAKDGTAAGSIADSTGVVTLISSALTTADITTLKIGGTTVTSTAAELNILDGVTSTAAELNILDGVTATATELNYVDGVTSAIQTQIDAKAPIANPTFTGSFTSPGIDDNADAIAITIDSSENVGIGGAPNAGWRNDATDRILTLGTEAAFHSDAGVTTELWNNAYVDNSDTFKNISTRGASRYMQYSGAHKWFTAASASAGSTISTEINSSPKMVLDVNGSLGIGTSSVNANLEIRGSSSNGQVRLGGSTSGVYGKLYSDNDGVFIVSADAGNSAANSYFGVEVDGSERMRISSSGDLILAANATGAALIKGVSGDQTDRNTGGYPQYTFVGNEGTGIRRPSANVLAFDTGGAETMRIDSSGNVAIGHTTTTGSKFAICDGANSQIQFYPEFSTNSNLTQHYDITAAAYMGAETRASSFTWRLGTARAMAIDSSGTVMDYIASGAGNADLRYHTGTSVVSYDTSSERFKTNIRDNTTYGLAAVNALQSRMFEYKDDGRTDVGLIAEEVVEVVPELVGLDDENNPLTVDYKRFVSVLVKAMQEQQEQIEDLKAEVAALKGA